MCVCVCVFVNILLKGLSGEILIHVFPAWKSPISECYQLLVEIFLEARFEEGNAIFHAVRDKIF
jgi:hypothetical protein